MLGKKKGAQVFFFTMEKAVSGVPESKGRQTASLCAGSLVIWKQTAALTHVSVNLIIWGH